MGHDYELMLRVMLLQMLRAVDHCSANSMQCVLI